MVTLSSTIHKNHSLAPAEAWQGWQDSLLSCFDEQMIKAGKQNSQGTVIKSSNDCGQPILLIIKGLMQLAIVDPWDWVGTGSSSGYFYKDNLKWGSFADHVLFQVLQQLPEDKAFLYIPTILKLLEMAGYHPRQIVTKENLVEAVICNSVTGFGFEDNFICLYSGKKLKSPGLFAGKSEHTKSCKKKSNGLFKLIHSFAENFRKREVAVGKFSFSERNEIKRLIKLIVRFCYKSIGICYSTKLVKPYEVQINDAKVEDLIGKTFIKSKELKYVITRLDSIKNSILSTNSSNAQPERLERIEKVSQRLREERNKLIRRDKRSTHGMSLWEDLFAYHIVDYYGIMAGRSGYNPIAFYEWLAEHRESIANDATPVRSKPLSNPQRDYYSFPLFVSQRNVIDQILKNLVDTDEARVLAIFHPFLNKVVSLS